MSLVGQFLPRPLAAGEEGMPPIAAPAADAARGRNGPSRNAAKGAPYHPLHIFSKA